MALSEVLSRGNSARRQWTQCWRRSGCVVPRHVVTVDFSEGIVDKESIVCPIAYDFYLKCSETGKPSSQNDVMTNDNRKSDANMAKLKQYLVNCKPSQASTDWRWTSLAQQRLQKSDYSTFLCISLCFLFMHGV